MERIISRRKQMAESVCVYSDTHPSADPNAAGVVTRLKAAVARITELGGQQKGGLLSSHASTARRTGLRRTIRNNLLRHLVTVANAAAGETAALLGMFEIPKANLSHARFENDARKMLDQGRAQRDLLLQHGLSATLLDDLAAALDAFNVSVRESTTGRQDHILARAKLRRVSDEIMELVDVIDGINRYRFKDQPELLAAWKSARHVVTGPQAAKDEVPGSSGPAPAGPGEVKPAA
jgi:hypothetical protein